MMGSRGPRLHPYQNIMAKAFYSQDEAKAVLKTSEDGLKELVRDGRLTEYRDGQQLMYKGSQVEALATSMRSDAISLTDTSIGGDSGSASVIGLADSGSGSGVGLAKDDTAGGLALADESLAPTPRQSLGESGITIFGPEDELADPMAQTQVGDTSGEQVNLEGIGSGSGLLDLTQEVGEDTSFGAETFDEIMPGEGSGMGTMSGMEEMETGAIDTGAIPTGAARGMMVAYEAYDPQSPIYGGLAAGAAFAVLLGLLGVAAAAVGAAPGMVSMFFDDNGNMKTFMALGVLFAMPIVGAIIGLVGGKLATS